MSAFSSRLLSLRLLLTRLPRRALVLGGLGAFALLGLLLASRFVPDPPESAAASLPSKPSPAAVPGLPAPLSTDVARKQIKFVTCLCRDAQGRVWIGTEDAGLWRYDPAAPLNADYLHFAAADGPGDDTIYALVCDKAGRLWAGTLNHGVAVFNGAHWASYAPPYGPLGCRVFALAVSPTTGGVWMATEAGLARYEQGQWTDYTRGDGLPSDSATSLAFAASGTLYVGTQCDGIAIGSPRDGFRRWRVVSGPASPPRTLRGRGLPSAMINCLHVTPEGTVWAGTTAGLARSSDTGRTWQFRRGGDWKDKAFGRFTSGYADVPKVNGIEVVFPNKAAFAVRAAGGTSGRFLAERGFEGGYTGSTDHPIDTSHVPGPAPQDVYRAERYGSFVFTANHLKPNARCRVRLHFTEVFFHEPGRRVFDVRINGRLVLNHFDIEKEAGGEYRAVVRGFPARTDAQGRVQIAFQGAAPGADTAGLGEDYVTCLGDNGANLLVGHRQQPPEAISLRTGAHQSLGATAYVNALLPLGSGTALAGNYGDGPLSLSVRDGRRPAAPASAPQKVAALPAPAAPPTLAQLNALLAQVRRVAPDPAEMRPHVTALADDWRTQGDWLGRYGRYWACLAAFFHPIPQDYLWGAGWEPVDYRLTMGPTHARGDSLRYWLQLRYTDNPRALEMPAAYLHSRVGRGYTSWGVNRRETEVDDHGEAYPLAMNGPNVYATLTVPPGLYYLSLYDFNKDGHNDDNRNRDYRLSVRAHPSGPLEDLTGFGQQPELAYGRIRDFWGGVYKRFLVRGPLTVSVEVNRNGSLNAILPAVMLDLVDETPAPYFQSVSAWQQAEAGREKERRMRTAGWARQPRVAPAASEAEAARQLFAALQEVRQTHSAWWATEGRRAYAALLRRRAASAPMLSACHYQLGQYADWEADQKAAHLTPARAVETALRWDGVTNSYSGLGQEIVTASLQARPRQEARLTQ